jgi:hypothetical protein
VIEACDEDLLAGKGKEEDCRELYGMEWLWVLGLISGLMAGCILLYLLGYLLLDG